MNNPIAELGSHDLRIAATILYRTSIVLRNLPGTPMDADTRIALYQSAKLAAKSTRVVLGEIIDRLEHFEAQELSV